MFWGTSFLVFPFFVFAGGYDIYVDAGYSGDDSDGSQERPYKSLNKAAENATGSRSIYLKNGEYEKATVGGSVKIIGQSKKAVIKGTLTLSGNNQLKNLTVSNGSPAVLISKNSDVTIDDCEIENFQLMGIQASPGDGKVTIKNSNVHGKGGKGIYIQEGRKIEITGNDIHDTGGEGLDIRARVSGTVSGNSIYGNSESGIEFIIGSSKITFSGNNIKSNGASAIASQFYRGTSKTGKVIIKNNTMSRNRKYGLDCAYPSGGDPASDYWGDSMELVENTIEGNKIKPISSMCNMIQAVDEEKEKEDNRISDVTTEKNIVGGTASQEAEIMEEEKKVIELEKIPEEELNYSVKAIVSRNKIKTFFFGPDHKIIKIAASELEQIKNKRSELFNLLKEADNPEDKSIIRERIGEISDIINRNEAILIEQENRFNLFGFFSKMLLTREDIAAIF